MPRISEPGGLPVLVTGANGFIGARVLAALSDRPRRGLVRQLPDHPVEAVDYHIGTLEDPAALLRACSGMGLVVHCAGFAHAMGSSAELARQHWQINHRGAVDVARAAVQAGVQRLVFLSSVKARGEPGAACANEDWPGEPETAYGQAKREAENELRVLADECGLELVILRPAMVYGRGGHGNLERLARLVAKGVFPALPETGNRRSLIHVADVVAAIRVCLEHPAAPGQCFNLCHPDAVSGAVLVASLRRLSGLSPQAWAFPRGAWDLLALAGECMRGLGWQACPVGRDVVSRLLDSACYDGARIERVLGWRPGMSLDAGLSEMLGVERRP